MKMDTDRLTAWLLLLPFKINGLVRIAVQNMDQEKYKDAIISLKSIAKSCFKGMYITIDLIGSRMIGASLPTSDLDITINLGEF